MIRFNYEYERRLKVAYLGCGGHSYRNIFPCFQFAPVDLWAVCDLQGPRAGAFARQFGARGYYTDYAQMLADVQPEAVFIVTGYDAQGRPTYPALPLRGHRLPAPGGGALGDGAAGADGSDRSRSERGGRERLPPHLLPARRARGGRLWALGVVHRTGRRRADHLGAGVLARPAL